MAPRPLITGWYTVPIPKAKKIPAAKAAADKEWDKLNNLSAIKSLRQGRRNSRSSQQKDSSALRDVDVLLPLEASGSWQNTNKSTKDEKGQCHRGRVSSDSN